MYQYTEFDQQFVTSRAAQYRDQLERNLAGKLGDDEFRPLRLQNGWYIQRHAPMLRIAVPYGELSSASCACWPRSPASTTSPRRVFKTPRTGRRPPRHPSEATATSPRARTCSSTGFRWPRAPT